MLPSFHGEQHKYTYFLRTIADISDNLKLLDDVIDNVFLPSLFGGDISGNIRDIVSLPIKEGGLGIRRVGENSNQLYDTSTKINKPLCRQILTQSDELPNVTEANRAKS